MTKREPALVRLLLSSALSVLFVVVRAVLVGHASYLFLLWNLYLAWCPYLLARLIANRTRANASSGFLCFLWATFVGFLPNAPYLVTDLMHLQGKTSAPYWFDALMFASFAWSGLVLGVASVRQTAQVVRDRVSPFAGTAYVIVVSALSAYGIYLGRFLRFNTWDAAIHPFSVGRELLAPLVHPREHAFVWLFTAAFSAFFLATYASLSSSCSTRRSPLA